MTKRYDRSAFTEYYDSSIRAKDEAILHTLLSLFRHKEQAETHRLRSLLERPDFIIFAAFFRNQPIAWVNAYVFPRFIQDECFLYEIDVLMQYQRHGVATALMNELQAWCRSRGIDEIFAIAETENTPANGLYAGCGGQPDKSLSRIFSWTLE